MNPLFDNFLIESGTKDTKHTGRSLYDHLVGTWKLLKEWECSDYVCTAGLFHSIYGTPVYKEITIDNRRVIQDLISKPSENLVYFFSIVEQPRNINFIRMSEPDRSDLLTISYANDIDQGDDWPQALKLSLHRFLPPLSPK